PSSSLSLLTAHHSLLSPFSFQSPADHRALHSFPTTTLFRSDRGAAGTSPAEHPGPPGEHPRGYGFPGHQKELGAAGYGRPAGPMAKPDEGSPPRDVSGPGASPAWDSGGEPTGWEAERRIYEAALHSDRTAPERWGRIADILPSLGSHYEHVLRGGSDGGQLSGVGDPGITEDMICLLARLEQQADSDVIDA